LPIVQERLKLELFLTIPEYPNTRGYVLDRIHAFAKSAALASYSWNATTEGEKDAGGGVNPFSSSLSSVVGFFAGASTASAAAASVFGGGASMFGVSGQQQQQQQGSPVKMGNGGVAAGGAGAGQAAGKPDANVKVPTDAEIIVHLVCCFLDEQMGGRQAFRNKYYVSAEQRPDSTAASIQILQKSKSPPHYNLFYRSKIFEVYPKRNNVFHMLSLFAYIISSTAGGYLGLLNLGGKSIGML
ncbi:hypothetical protein HDU98_006062, partial [Podochytrium sp. JEL0797]